MSRKAFLVVCVESTRLEASLLGVVNGTIKILERLTAGDPEISIDFLRKISLKAGRGSVEAFLVLPRASFYMTSRPGAADVLDPIAHQLLTSLLSGMVVGVLKTRAGHLSEIFKSAGFRLKGFIPEFLVHVEAQFPESSDPGDWVLIHRNDAGVSITAVRNRLPLVCLTGRTVDHVVSFAQTIHPDFKPQRIVGKKPDVAPSDFVRILIDKKLFVPAEEKIETRHQKIWRRHRKNILALGTLAMALLSIFLRAPIEAASQTLLRLERRMKQTSTAGALRGKADRVLPVLESVMKSIPSNGYVMDFRYEEPQHALILRGRCADYACVSKLAGSLGRQPVFRDVQTEKSSLITVANRSVVEFLLKAEVR